MCGHMRLCVCLHVCQCALNGAGPRALEEGNQVLRLLLFVLYFLLLFTHYFFFLLLLLLHPQSREGRNESLPSAPTYLATLASASLGCDISVMTLQVHLVHSVLPGHRYQSLDLA